MSTADRVGTAIVFKGKDRLLEAASKANDSNAMVPRIAAPWEQEVSGGARSRSVCVRARHGIRAHLACVRMLLLRLPWLGGMMRRCRWQGRRFLLYCTGVGVVWLSMMVHASRTHVCRLACVRVWRAAVGQVRDAEGRRRFHGAFTGGFSAGYYNTVGSAEGWAPSQFVSSRKARAEVRAQRPEDFMDEDDDPMLGRKLAARDEFDTLGARAAARASTTAVAAAAGPSHIPGPLPGELIVPSAAPIGKKLLRCMGWRDGQGLGPRAARQRKKKQKQKKQKKQEKEARAASGGAATAPGTDGSDVDSDATPPPRDARPRTYGATLPPHMAAQRAATSVAGGGGGSDGSDSDDDDPYAEGILFAPKNARVVRVVQKDNLYGLGFDPHENAPEFRRASSALALTSVGDGEGGGRAIIRMDAVFKAGGGTRGRSGCVGVAAACPASRSPARVPARVLGWPLVSCCRASVVLRSCPWVVAQAPRA